MREGQSDGTDSDDAGIEDVGAYPEPTVVQRRGILAAGLRRVNSVLGLFDLKLVRSSDAQRSARDARRYRTLLHRFHINESALFEPTLSYSSIPDEARDYLRVDNPRLTELIRRYKALDHPILAHSLWTDDYVSRDIDLRAFRGDQAYVYQLLDLNTEINYYVTTNYLEETAGNLLERLSEDGLFSSYVLTFRDRVVSRDLLDSVNEIRFLEGILGLSGRTNFNVLDIGAGYGRLAHRLAEALPPFGKIFCVDAVAVSTFLCEFYLRFRRMDDRVSVVPLDELETCLSRNRVDLAINIHSFSECSLTAITAWIDLLARHKIRYLFIVPHEIGQKGLRSREPEDPTGELRRYHDYLPRLYNGGYGLIYHGPKYDDEVVQRHGVTPAEYYLFEFTGE